LTNRFDLTTYDLIKLYGFRWQVELFFRYLKQTLQAKHLLNLSEPGVAIHFYLVLIAHLLLVIYKYQQ
jgi:IS4 transposase